MSTDLTMLVWTALLSMLLPLTYVAGRSGMPGGLAWGFGNRATKLPAPEWVGRAERAHLNLVENLAPFAILVLAAHVAGRADARTALGSTLFFWSRVAHAGVYMAGIPYLRTVVFFVGTAGELLILSRVL